MILLTWPIHGLLAVINEVIRQAEEAMYDQAALQNELKTLYARLEAGEMEEEEFTRRENELAERLALAEQFHRSRRRASH